MIKRLAGVTVWSEDLKNLLPFYRDVLGLKVGMESPDFVLFGDMNTPGLGLGTHSEVRGRNSDAARHMVGFETDDISAESKRLKEAGVELVEGPYLSEDLWIATLKDPEGNLIQLFQFERQS
jgi:predicted enzyme related to lactoylglutathione lyase